MGIERPLGRDECRAQSRHSDDLAAETDSTSFFSRPSDGTPLRRAGRRA